MKIFSLHRSFLKFALFLLLPSLAGAQNFYSSSQGDVNAGFRIITPTVGTYEMVVYLGNITSLMALTPGTVVTITNYSYQQLTNTCPHGFGHLQWSVFSSSESALSGTLGTTGSTVSYPAKTCWYTLARSSPGVQTTAPARISHSDAGSLEGSMISVGTGGTALSESSSEGVPASGTYNNYWVILEPSADDNETLNTLSYYLTSAGDFGGGGIDTSVENIAPASFTSSLVSDFYMNVPGNATDPINSSSTTAEYLGYFTLTPGGTLTYTVASANTAPSAGSVTGSVTNGFGPLTVVFTNTASGSITNWVWNFGNGTIITNITGLDVTNTYATAGNYTVTLTVNGPGGSSTNILANYIVASPTPELGSLTSSGGNLVFSGSNCPVGIQYRILSSTNLVSWTPVFTNTFASNGSFAYTNSISKTNNAYFVLVSP